MPVDDAENPRTTGTAETDVTDPRLWDDLALQRALDAAGDDGWGPVAVLPSTGSTNADAVEQVREGAPEGFTVVTDEQSEGRGRLGRVWDSPAGAGLTMSVVLRPRCPVETWGWVPLLSGIAVVDALRGRGVPAALKWPNDVVVDRPARDGSAGPRKLGGLLVERVSDAQALVVGIGINIDLDENELPVARATSTRLEGVAVAREGLLVDVLTRLRRRYAAWQDAGGDAVRAGLAEAYVQRSITIGRPVRALLPGGGEVEADATGIDSDGRLLLRSADGSTRALSAGDIEHLR